MGTQKVPRTAKLHCTDRTYGNAYLITIKVEPFSAHTLLPLLEASAENFFWNLSEFDCRIRLDALYGCEICPRIVQWLGNHRKVFLDEELLHNKWCVARCIIVMHKPLSLPLTFLLSPNCIAQRLQNLHVKMASIVLSKRYKLMMHQSVDVKEFRELFDCPSYTLLWHNWHYGDMVCYLE
jgi:hypothetical protein